MRITRADENSSGNLVGWRDIGGSSISYSIVGVGDVNGDHVSDVLWRNNSLYLRA